jgi:hypothetical protein
MSVQRIPVRQFLSQLSAEQAFADEALRRHYQREYAAKDRSLRRKILRFTQNLMSWAVAR